MTPHSAGHSAYQPQAHLSRALMEWFWQHGCRRGERPSASVDWDGSYQQFSLPTGTWLRQLYEVHRGFETLHLASEKKKPCVALWGLSQTGKSTSVSALIDANAHVEPFKHGQPATARQLEIDGQGGGLHWPGGLPFYFARFGSDAPSHWYERTLNPFNAGKDASSCISRFVAASLTPEPGLWQVTDPIHPVEVQFVSSGELLHALARGFDSECLGPSLKGKPEAWTPDRLDRALEEFRASHRASAGRPLHRQAYERMLAIVETLQDLVFARVETFARLRTTDADWESRLEQLLSDPLLTCDPAITDELASVLFWQGSTEISLRFQAMRQAAEALRNRWGDGPLFVSLPVASLLLDMDSCVNISNLQTAPGTRESRQRQLILQLGARRDGNRVVVGSGPEYPEKLVASPVDYCNLQGLVWELTIPVNLAHLPDGAFRDLLLTADILDFPGVGRNEKDEHTRLNAADGTSGGGTPWSLAGFYSEVVKRGKTASIVATYSRRLTIDSFTILQNIDKDDPKNNATDQLANGIRTWLRNMAPGFTEGGSRRPAGVALNLALTFWGEFVKDGRADKSANFELRRKFYDKLGVISDPAVTTVFALNYHWLRDSRVAFPQPFAPGTQLYEAMVREPEFLRLFNNPISLRSVQEMAQDLTQQASGGADFLFAQMRDQVRELGAGPREDRFAPLSDRLAKVFHTLLGWRHLRKPVVEHDTRPVELTAFVDRLHSAIHQRPEADVRRASHALRELLNVDPESVTLPALGRGGFTGEWVENLFNEWRNRQVQRYDLAQRERPPAEPAWERLGVRDRGDFSRIVDALITSLDRSVFAEIATFCQRAWDTIPGRTAHRQQHLRRYVALEMTNWLLYRNSGRKPRPSPARFTPPARGAGQPTGAATAAYASFIGPFVEVQIAEIKAHLAPTILRPDLHGDASLDQLLSLPH